MAEKDLKENPFRDEIFAHLLAEGYIEGRKADYDYKHALDTGRLFEFLATTQPEELKKLQGFYKTAWKQKYLELLCRKIDEKGLLAALNEWVEDYPSNAKFRLVYFKSSLQAMSDNQALYEKNIFSIRREFAYEDKENSFRVDLALFVNGIPLVMIELKKQTAGQKAGFEGTKQFRTTRNPDELIFRFNRRTLAYFAVDEFMAFVATRLDGKSTRFLPFNKGSEDEGAGNPIVDGHHSTYYLWEEILQKDMLLRIVREFMFIDDEGTLIFPRYHQLYAVLRAEEDVMTNGVGGRYLIWHSAGSGKTKTIAWLARRLINLPDIKTVVVISDRSVIDSQLGNELKMLDNKRGVAKWIDTTSQDLLKMLNEGGYIIVTTLQKFRPILNEIQQRKDRNYAIIIDEAHSSTAGRSLSKASETLTGKSLKDSIELDEAYDDQEDIQNQLFKDQALIESVKNVSYFAFTATPKNKTMELFGTRTGAGRSYFHKYSMKQAIEEGFIVNPLLCYTIYNDTYRITRKKSDEKEYDSARAQAAILNYVTTSDEVIEKKTKIIIDDFMTRRRNWLDGKAKAMIVTPSRKHAVCYRLAVDRYLKDCGCNFRACVAFTGNIDFAGEKHSEESMNKGFRENDIKALIRNNDDVRIIIVADKLQTGFDEPRLCVMYIDKKLNSPVKTVQTISRLNRPARNKMTFVLDFVNSAATIKEHFSHFYGGEMYLPTENETDPNILFSKRDKILDFHVVTLEDCHRLHQLIAQSESSSGELSSYIARLRRAFNNLETRRQKLFTGELNMFVKLFYYISAVYSSWNEDMKLLATVFEVLHRVFHEKSTSESIDAAELVELSEYTTSLIADEFAIKVTGEDVELYGVSAEVGVTGKNFSTIDEIIKKFNLKYAGADDELGKMIDDLSQDDEIIVNVKNSRQGAYEAAVAEKVESSITDGLLEGTSGGDDEKAAFFAGLSSNRRLVSAIANAVIGRIKASLSSLHLS